MDIYNVMACKFISMEPSESVYRLITEGYSEHYCVIDENSVATDIFTKEQFYILKKDVTNRILASEKDKIVMNQTYGIHAKKVNLSYLNEIEQKKLRIAYLEFENLKKEKTKQNVIKR